MELSSITRVFYYQLFSTIITNRMCRGIIFYQSGGQVRQMAQMDVCNLGRVYNTHSLFYNKRRCGFALRYTGRSIYFISR